MKMGVFGALVFGVVLVFSSGCDTPGLNPQRAALRGTGDISVSTALDLVSREKAPAVQQKTKEIAEAVRLFLKSGKVADLTIPEITTELEKLIPEKYRFLLEIIIAQIEGVTLPVDVIGVNNVRRIDALCVGLITGCNEYDMKDHPPAPNTLERSISNDIEVYGSELKRQVFNRK